MGFLFVNIKTLVMAASIILAGSAQAELNLEVSETILSVDADAPVVTSSVNFSSVGLKRLRAVRSRSIVIEDPELNAWIRGLGRRLVAHTSYAGRPFYFVIVRDNEVNAYATQGGLIVIHSGLILRTRSESELAAVMAHEIAHITQQHIERMIAQSKNSTVGNAAAVVAGLLVGSKDPTAGQAIVTSAMAIDAHRSLRFGRSAETEADREGLRILAKARFDPHGMTRFLRKLNDGQDPRYSDITQYLSTHPLSTQRVNDIQQWAQRYGAFRGKSRLPYFYMQEKLQKLTRAGKSGGHVPASVKRYGQAYQALLRGNAQLALKQLPVKTQIVPEVILQAKSYHQLGQYQKAVDLLKPQVARYPLEESLLLPLANAWLGLGQVDAAWQTIGHIALVEQTSLEFLETRQEVARLAGHLAQAYLSIAERNIRIGAYTHALSQLQQALKLPKLTSAERQLVERAIFKAKRFKKR